MPTRECSSRDEWEVMRLTRLYQRAEQHIASAVRRQVRRFALGLIVPLMCVVAACAQGNAPHPGPYYPDLHTPASPTGTIAPLGYTVAAWPADSAPMVGESHTIFVTFRNAGRPIARAQVTLSVRSGASTWTYGPLDTDATGYAAFTLSGTSEKPNQPVLVLVSVNYEGQTFSTSTNYTPAP